MQNVHCFDEILTAKLLDKFENKAFHSENIYKNTRNIILWLLAVSHAGARVFAPISRTRAVAVSFSWCSSLFPLASPHLTDVLTQLTEGN
jgi:hypothetical protein